MYKNTQRLRRIDPLTKFLRQLARPQRITPCRGRLATCRFACATWRVVCGVCECAWERVDKLVLTVVFGVVRRFAVDDYVMSKITFTVVEKLVKARDGAAYDLSRYVEGVDYVRRKAFKGERVLFRKGFLDGSSDVSAEAAIDDAEEAATVADEVAPLKDEVDLLKEEPQPDVILAPDCGVQKTRVIKVHVNSRWVETEVGRVWVGGQGARLRVGTIINVRAGMLVR